MQSDSFLFEKKPVFDYNHVPLGTVSGAVRDPRTREARQLVLTLSPQAQKELGTTEATLELPASMIFGMRRDAVQLDRSLLELKREGVASALKK